MNGSFILWLLVATAVAGSSVFVWVGSQTTLDVAAQLKKNKQLVVELNKLHAEFQDVQTVAQDVTVPPKCTVFVGDLEQPNQYPEHEFVLTSSTDPDSQITFDLSALASDAFVTLHVQNTSGEVAYLSDVEGQTSTFHDDTFRVFHVDDSDKRLAFDLSALTNGAERYWEIQADSGIVAYLTDLVTFTTSFSDAEFVIVGAVDDTRKLTFDLSGLAPDTTRVLTVQNTSGTVAYESDAAAEIGVHVDDVFTIFAADNPDKQIQFLLDGLSSQSNIELKVQDRSGTIGYVQDAPTRHVVTILTDRFFPDAANEGGDTLEEVGIDTIRLTMCGAGGAGFSRAINDDSGFSAGGGAGGGVLGLLLTNLTTYYEKFDIRVGTGSGNVLLDCTQPENTDAGNTRFISVPRNNSVNPNDMEINILGERGECGRDATLPGQFVSSYGARGGRVIANVGLYGYTKTVPTRLGHINTGPKHALFHGPWFSGGHGSMWRTRDSLNRCTWDHAECRASDMIGAGNGGSNGHNQDDGDNEVQEASEGAGGLFGPGLQDPDPTDDAFDCAPGGNQPTCAGGASRPGNTQLVNDDSKCPGGRGVVMIEYWTR